MLKDWKAVKGQYPAAYLDKPRLYPWLQWYLDAWDDLGASRNYDQGYPLSTPASEILAYCGLFRIDWPEVREELFYFCGKLDAVYCGWAGEKEEDRDKFLKEMEEEIHEVYGYSREDEQQ